MKHDPSLGGQYPHLVAQWDADKNGYLTPAIVRPQSHKKVWWKCDQGHSWQAAVYVRAAGSRCPYCSGRKVLPGFNDLATTHPHLAPEWHPDKNLGLTPQHISCGYKQMVWWRCDKGHEWQASPAARGNMASGCPVCANRVVIAGHNDLQTTHSNLAAQWHPDKNGALTPAQVVAGSSKVVWWKCALGHQWRAKIADRAFQAHHCPYCVNQKVLAGFNDLATTHPGLTAEWHPTQNGALRPTQVTAGSSRRVWWMCEKGHEWRAVVYNRTRSAPTGCPVCARRQKHQTLLTDQILQSIRKDN